MSEQSKLNLLNLDRDTLPGEVDWWFEPGNKADRFAEDIIALCREGGSLSERNGLALLGLQWHAEKNRPLPLSMLKALACVLDLVIWKGRDPVPAMAIRDCLGLPAVRELDKFLSVAHAAPGQTNSELGREIGVGHNTVGRWRSMPDFDRWRDAGVDAFFPFGLQGVPHSDEMPAARFIVEYCNSNDTDRLNDSQWRRQWPSALAVEPRVAAFRLALHAASAEEPMKDDALYAAARLLGAVSPNTGSAVPLNKHILQRLGLPGNVKQLKAFLEAARRDGDALGKGISPDEGLDLAVAEVDRRLADGWLMDLPNTAVHHSTIKDWRSNPVYRRFARSSALWPSLHEFAWSRFRAAKPRP